MRSKLPGMALVLAGVLCLPCSAQVGGPLPSAKLEGFAQTKARGLSDFTGRVLLLEYFAYW